MSWSDYGCLTAPSSLLPANHGTIILSSPKSPLSKAPPPAHPDPIAGHGRNNFPPDRSSRQQAGAEETGAAKAQVRFGEGNLPAGVGEDAQVGPRGEVGGDLKLVAARGGARERS